MPEVVRPAPAEPQEPSRGVPLQAGAAGPPDAEPLPVTAVAHGPPRAAEAEGPARQSRGEPLPGEPVVAAP